MILADKIIDLRKKYGWSQEELAAQLGVSQPTVTGQLRQLESRYGVELFHRQGRGMRLSDAGHSLMPMVEKLVQQETEIDFRLRDASDLREGNLRIGATGVTSRKLSSIE